MPSNLLQKEIFSSLYSYENKSLFKDAQLFFERNADQILVNFYQTLSSQPETSNFLTNDVVEVSLKQALKKWLNSVFNFEANKNFTFFEENNKRVGDVHARIRVPLNYVNFGVDNLKQQVYKILLLENVHNTANVALANLISRAIDLSAMVFNDAYVKNSIKQEKNEQNLRNHYISHNLALEFEQSRADLLHWHRIVLTALFNPYSKSKFSHIVSLRKSKFGLWLDHRATVLFHNQKEVQKFQDKIDEIDLVIELILHLNKSDNWEQLAQETGVLNTLVTNTDWLLAQIAKDLANLENNKDPLTRMFTRRYLPNIIQQEIRYCLENDTRLGIIMVDLDHFKNINDTYGHGVGDAVLKQTAAMLSNSIRPYDYIFRYGGEEFLIIINNTNEDSCLAIAENIRVNIEKHKNKELLLIKDPITISLGVAIFNKHPDYEQLINQADKALYLAKENGRNRVELYQSSPQETSSLG